MSEKWIVKSSIWHLVKRYRENLLKYSNEVFLLCHFPSLYKTPSNPDLYETTIKTVDTMALSEYDSTNNF